MMQQASSRRRGGDRQPASGGGNRGGGAQRVARRALCDAFGTPLERLWNAFGRLLVVVWGCWGAVGGSLGLARPSPHPPAPTRAVSGAQLLDFGRKLPWVCTTFVFFELVFDSDTKNTLFLVFLCYLDF